MHPPSFVSWLFWCCINQSTSVTLNQLLWFPRNNGCASISEDRRSSRSHHQHRRFVPPSKASSHYHGRDSGICEGRHVARVPVLPSNIFQTVSAIIVTHASRDLANTLTAEMPRRDTARNAPKDVLGHCLRSRVVKVEDGMLARGYTLVLDFGMVSNS